jgi:hypothetical protein
MTGTPIRNAEPHQKNSSSAPPTSGPSAAPARKLVNQIEIATVRCSGSWDMFRISTRVDGASVAPATPSSARAAISISSVRRERRDNRRNAERGGTDEQQPPAADPVAQGAHRDQEPGDHEATDVDDPQQLGIEQGGKLFGG